MFWKNTFKRWIFEIDGKMQSVTLEIDFFQKRMVRYDGALLIEDQVHHNGGSKYTFEREGHEFKIVIESAYFSLRRLLPRENLCHLYMDTKEIL